MDIWQTVFTASVTSGLVSAGVNWYLKIRERDEQRRWDLKREACLDALRIIDSRFADYDWKDKNGAPSKIDPQEFVTTADIRSCFNRLIVACGDPDVPKRFENCLNLDMGDGKACRFDMNTVVDLRNAIRAELGFGGKLITNVSWIKNIKWKDKG